MRSSRRLALSTLRSLKQFDNYYRQRHRRFFSSESNASPTPTVFPTLREVPKTLTTSSGKFLWPDEYDWISKRRHAREFDAHVDAENRASSSSLSFFASYSTLAASLAAEARRFSLPSRRCADYVDSVPERIGEYSYFTRTGIEDGSCSLLRKNIRDENAEVVVVVDVAGVASSLDAVSLGQLKLSPCGGAVAMTLDVGGGGELWRLVVVEAGGRGRGGGGGKIIGSVDGVTSVEWGGWDVSSSSSIQKERPLLLPPLFYTRGGAGNAVASSPSTLHVAPWDASAKAFRFDNESSTAAAAPPPPPLFVEGDPSRVLALGKSKDGSLLTLASASAAGSAAYALRLPRREDFASSPSSSSSSMSATSSSSPSSSSSSSSSSSPSSPSPLLSRSALTCVAPFEEGVEHYLEHCDAVPGGVVVMTTAAEGGRGRKRRRSGGEFWLAAPLAGGDVASRRALPFPPPSEWPALLPTREDEVLNDIDVYRDSVLCYGRCTSTGRPRLSLLHDLGNKGEGCGGGGDDDGKSSRKLSPTLQRVELPSPTFSPHSKYCVVRPGANADPDAASARLELSSPLAPPTAFDLDLASGAWSSPPDPDLSSPSNSHSYLTSVVSELEVAVEKTGRGRVPVTIVRPRRSGKEDEEKENSDSSPPPPPPRPVLLTLYGAYGTPLDPDFDPVRLALAKEETSDIGTGGGWDLAFAHLRGGGELGRRWHAAGRGPRRRRVLEDAKEVVEWLSRGGSGGGVGWAGGGGRRRRPVALCAESAGALVAGALLADGETSRLLSAVSLRVPFLDVLSGIAGEDDEDDEHDREMKRRQRSLLDHERGEFASASDREGDDGDDGDDDDDDDDDDEDAIASSLASVCPYHLLLRSKSLPLDGPPVLVTAAEHDARAPVAGAVKWVSRLRRLRRGKNVTNSNSSSSVVLLEVLRGCGHAEGLRSVADVDRNAREAAFLVDAVEKGKRENEK